MRALADFIMRGRTQAILVVAGGALLPMLFWLSAAAGSLVLLRRGLSDALSILVWALLPAIGWWWFGEPRTLLVVLGALGLALVLRTSASWVKVLLASVPVGVVFGLVLGNLFAEQIQAVASELQKLMPQLIGSGWEQLSADEQGQLLGLMVPVLTGLMASLLQIVTV